MVAHHCNGTVGCPVIESNKHLFFVPMPMKGGDFTRDGAGGQCANARVSKNLAGAAACANFLSADNAQAAAMAQSAMKMACFAHQDARHFFILNRYSERGMPFPMTL
ncbi:hypothetical protein ASJ78_01971 [Serratia marcescens]|nr:hypothetical protein ASJ78_01971 [Serratia marcescens]